MTKLIKFFLVLFALLSFNLSAIASYGLQFADSSRTVRLHWKKNKIPIALSTSFTLQNPSIMPQNDVEGAVRRSLEAWEQISNIKFEIVSTDKQTVSPSGSVGDGVSLITIAQTPENLLLFGNETDEISAQTRIFYNRQGLISEADIVLNPYQQFSTDGSIGTYDLEATLTHEIGHLLGLDHSSVLGATMHARQGKNGVYNLSAFASRTLAEDDVTGIRALYGAKSLEDSCCGTVIGKFTDTNGKVLKNLQVWGEDADSGRIVGSVSTKSDGSFRFERLEAGSYRFYAQVDGKSDDAVSEELGAFEVGKGKTVTIIRKLKTAEKNFNVQYAGFNGQISDLAVPLNSGKSYLIYIGGKNLDAEDLKIGFNSSYFSITPDSITKHDYGSEVSVVSFEIKVDTETPTGEYSIFVKSQSGVKQFLIGSLTVENFLNPWSSYALPGVYKE
jgi:hypothetical protein